MLVSAIHNNTLSFTFIHSCCCIHNVSGSSPKLCLGYGLFYMCMFYPGPHGRSLVFSHKKFKCTLAKDIPFQFSELNAFLRSQVVLKQSIRDGFVSEFKSRYRNSRGSNVHIRQVDRLFKQSGKFKKSM